MNAYFLLSKFDKFYVWPIVIPIPVEIEGHTVPHFKAQFNAKVVPWGLEGDGTFM